MGLAARTSPSNGPVPVLLLVRELGIGGCEADLTKIATGLDRGRFTPHVGCLRPAGLRVAQLRAAEVPIVELPIRGMLSPSWLRGARRLIQYVREHQIRLVHTFDAPMDVLTVPAAWAARVPVIVKSHLWYRNMVRHHGIMAITDRIADRIVVNSRAVEEDLVRRWGVGADRTYLCYNGVDLSIFQPPTGFALSNTRTGKLTIGTVCALRPEKRVDRLVAAFAALRAAGVEARLLIVGGGPLREALEAQARTLGIADVTEFQSTTNAVADRMRQIDVFVLASDSESFPNALLEAMASGCCVVASSVGGVPELVRDGENGLLFRREDPNGLTGALHAVIADPKRRLSMGAAAHSTARDDFSVGRFVARTEALYESLLSREVE